MKNKELTKLINKMKKCYGVMDYYLAYNEVDLLLNYIEQLENNRDKAIERCEFWLDFYRNVNNDKRIILRLNDILSKLKGGSE